MGLKFHEMGLDDRILKAISRLGWAEPTLIQEKAIPLALEGKDILARARTGSGKTASYAIPLIQKILVTKQVSREQNITGIVMTPTKELCNQAHKNVQELANSCSREVRCVDISDMASLDSQKPLLIEKPDIVVGTPSRILSHLKAGNLSLKQSMEMLVIDEADLVFSFGYEADVRALINYLPKIYQAFLMSATLDDDVKLLKKLVLHNAVTLKLEESQLPETNQLTQYHLKCEEEDKFVLIYTLVKLGLIRGKTIVFVNSVDRCYKLRLFLEQFGIPSCVVNSELPVNSRCHIIHQFNDGLYNIVIAADEGVLSTTAEEKNTKEAKGKKIKRGKRKDKESGVSRGIDFQMVSNVVNFDFPPDVDAYVHRVGRTARGDNKGSALSFVSVKEMPLLKKVETSLAESHESGEYSFKPYQFRMEEIEGFRYRAKDAMRTVTRIAVKEARMKEIRSEILNSQKLKTYFEDNPRDLQLLRHDKGLHTIKVQQHMKHVPEYLVPPTLRHLKHPTKPKDPSQKGTSSRTLTKGEMKFRKRKANPLKSFEFAGLNQVANKKKKRKKT